MNVKIYAAIIAFVVVAGGAGVAVVNSSPERIPEVNEQNCRSDLGEKIKDSELRKDFRTKCFLLRKPKESSGRSW